MDQASSAVPVTLGRQLHPRHGVHAPRSGLPQRRPGTIRRTSTLDAHRPDGLLGDLLQHARARDLFTDRDGIAHVLGEASVDTRVDYGNRSRLVELVSNPDRPELQALIGCSVSTGFRAAMTEAVPGEAAAASLLHLLLDDLPGSALVSGYAIGAAGVLREHTQRRQGESLQVPGLCAGFQEGGTIVAAMRNGEQIPMVTGPAATSIVPADDPAAWHELGVLGPHDMRRWRCLDLTPGEVVEIEAYFRDSHMGEDGVETVIHEYTVSATIDRERQEIMEASAVSHTLPWMECIEARDSTARLAGRALLGLRASVRAEWVGITTCTHLNDTMRSLEDVRALLTLI